MANVKRIDISGELPFHLQDFPEVMEILATLNLPSFGFNIQWGKAHYVPNDEGGKTAWYEFCIHGTEAVTQKAIERWLAILAKVGHVNTSSVTDLET
jgi:hypothetical protein